MQVCNNLATDEIDDHRIQSDYKCIRGRQNPEEKNSTLGIASAWRNRARHQWQRDHQLYCVCVEKPSTTPMTTWPPRPRAPSTQRTWTSTREWCTPDPMCAWSSSQVLVVMIAHHIVAQVSLVRVISWSSHDERISSTLSPPFPSTSSSSHSSPISCTSSCTSTTTLRAVVTLRTSPERRWTPLTTPTSSQKLQKTEKNILWFGDCSWL